MVVHSISLECRRICKKRVECIGLCEKGVETIGQYFCCC